jgi:hypothetical protein
VATIVVALVLIVRVVAGVMSCAIRASVVSAIEVREEATCRRR